MTGYNFYVRRQDGDIAEEEWLGYVNDNVHGLRRGDVEGLDGPVVVAEPAPGVRVGFYFLEGDVLVRTKPDVEILKMLVEVAVALGARLVGESGEIYGPGGLLDAIS